MADSARLNVDFSVTDLEENFWDKWHRFFTDRMPFLSPSQQCGSGEGISIRPKFPRGKFEDFRGRNGDYRLADSSCCNSDRFAVASTSQNEVGRAVLIGHSRGELDRFTVEI